ncbi:hypothetical protein GWK47_038628 [Chionoecetes opilio]|uniref:Uncharacterized protein n=1 Tax=Chionoecetes opilio TaxID=41210 RepID=A0A8J5D1S1_CHIOP|nr:hypothetical protein GWK47_038628 [Chionoecetes opilio]
MVGKPMRIHVKEGSRTMRHSHTEAGSLAFQRQVQGNLSRTTRQGIIKPAGDDPSEWCHPLVVVAKDKGVRITVDLTKLNSPNRPAQTPSCPTPFTAVRSCQPVTRFFTTADALCGYWQLETTRGRPTPDDPFITPYGRFSTLQRGPWVSQLPRRLLSSTATWPCRV